jgi:branched-chain amino acid transport system substrate-binding protein
MSISRRKLLGTTAAVTAAVAIPGIRRARAAGNVIKIGVLTDLSGPYRDISGPTDVACTKQAVAEMTANGYTVEVITGDHQNKPDIGAGLARQWYDTDGVDMILAVPNSAVALAVSAVSKEKNKLFIDTQAATSVLTGTACHPSFIHWVYDTYELANSTAGATVKAGGDSWYFLVADYAFGHQLEADSTSFIKKFNGTVKGSSAYPFPGTTDFSSFLLQAQSSGAKVLGLCNAGADTVNSIKQAHEFGLTKSMTVAALLAFVNDIHSLGLETAQGLHLTETFYWDLNEGTRAFTKRVLPATPDNYPNMGHAGDYSATRHLIKAVNKMGIDVAKKATGTEIANVMKSIPIEDDAFGHGTIREDGRVLIPAYLFQVKTPAESKGPWDLYKLVSTLSADEAWRPLADGHCPFVKA